MMDDDPAGDPGLDADATARHVPRWARRVLLVGCADEAVGRALRARGATVYGVEPDPARQAAASAHLDGVVDVLNRDAPPPLPESSFDAVVLGPPLAPFALLAPLLAENGRMTVLTAAAGDADRPAADAAACGLRLYRREAGSDGCAALTFVRAGYRPVEHAQALSAAQRFRDALDVLDGIPEGYLDDLVLYMLAAVEKQICLLGLARTADPAGRLALFFRAQQAFYLTQYIFPRVHAAYRLQAEFWHLLGNADMAARLLRSLLHVAPDADTARQLEGYAAAPPARSVIEEAPDPTPRPMRLLILNHGLSDYGMDTLYHGLCLALGDGHVVEYPWKPTLHGESAVDAGKYPCVFHHAGRPCAPAQLAAELSQGRFDAVIIADVLGRSRPEEIRPMLAAAAGLPVFLLDTWDDCSDQRGLVRSHFGVERLAGYFKREMLAGVDYGPDAWPCPFAYPDARLPALDDRDRPDELFWAGHRQFGLRRLYLERLEDLLGRAFDRDYKPAEYAEALLRSRIGLNIFGFGFDTVRFWEVPAHGCMLLSERPPIRIPHDFIDGVSAVFFDDLPGLEDRLAWCREHPAEVHGIAETGHAHLRRYHTATARARQVLARIERVLRAGG